MRHSVHVQPQVPKMRVCWAWLLALLLATVGWTLPLAAHDTASTPGSILNQIGFDQQLGKQLPLTATFTDERKHPVHLGEYFTGKPVLLWLGYLTCPNLCPLSRHGLVESLEKLTFSAGNEFQVVMISIDPQETSEQASQVKQQTLADYNRPAAAQGWHILTGVHAQIDQVTNVVGFRYAYDATQAQYAHASGVVLATGSGRIARYLFGIEYAPRDLRLGLVEAGENTIASPIDRVLLFCYDYDPTTGHYTLFILRMVRIAAVATVFALGAFVWLNQRSALAGSQATHSQKDSLDTTATQR